MKSISPERAELEAELLKLNALVRQRRMQLARLESCPHKDCECRQVWTEVVDQKLASQVGAVRKKIREKAAKKSKIQARPRSRRTKR